jgi:sugar-phosphatase
VIVPVDEIHNAKPHPEGFLHAAQRLGVAVKDCIVFEDTHPGIEAGVNAGMQVVALLTTARSQDLKHHLLIKDFRDVMIQLDGDYMKLELNTVA